MCERHWVNSPIFSDEYLVSDDGIVKSLRQGKDLKPNTDKDGYKYCVLSVNGKRMTVKIHRLVALAFVPNPDNKPAIDHIDGDKTNNHASNLKWVTNKENTNNPVTINRLLRTCTNRDFKRMGELRNFGRKETAVYADGKLIGVFESQYAASKYTDVSEGKISQCVSGKKKSCKGYEFVGVYHAEEKQLQTEQDTDEN